MGTTVSANCHRVSATNTCEGRGNINSKVGGDNIGESRVFLMDGLPGSSRNCRGTVTTYRDSLLGLNASCLSNCLVR